MDPELTVEDNALNALEKDQTIMTIIAWETNPRENQMSRKSTTDQ